MSDPNEKKVIVHASVWLSGAFEVDMEAKKLVSISDQALQSHNIVVAVGGELAPEAHDNISNLACQKLIKAYLDEGARNKTVTPNLPPAQGVH